MITQKELKELLQYNPDNGIWTWLSARGKIKAGDRAGYVDKDGYVIISILGKSYRSARLAWLYMTGKFPDCEIDHDNRVRNDDRWENLKDSNRAENNFNRSVFRNNTSGYLGVGKSNLSKKYRSRITLNGKPTYLGTFDTPEKAHEAYLEAKKKYQEGL